MSFPPMGDEFYTQHPQEVEQGEFTNMKAQLGRANGPRPVALLATLLATLSHDGCLLRGSSASDTSQRHQELYPHPMVVTKLEARLRLKSHF